MTELEYLRKLHAEATPGPWDCTGRYYVVNIPGNALPDFIAAVQALEQNVVELEEAGKLLHAATINGTRMHGSASLFTIAAERTRAALAPFMKERK